MHPIHFLSIFSVFLSFSCPTIPSIENHLENVPVALDPRSSSGELEGHVWRTASQQRAEMPLVVRVVLESYREVVVSACEENTHTHTKTGVSIVFMI